MVCRLHRQEIRLNRMQPVNNAYQYRCKKGARVTCRHACQRQSHPGFYVISKTTWYIQILDSLQLVLIRDLVYHLNKKKKKGQLIYGFCLTSFFQMFSVNCRYMSSNIFFFKTGIEHSLFLCILLLVLTVL